MGLLDPPGFRRNRHGQAWLMLPDTELALMTNLLDQLAALLAPPERDTPTDPLEELVGIDPGAVRPADPALARLFPDAYTDADQADEFRRFTQRDLRTGKLESIATVQGTLRRPMPTQLTAQECQAWVRTLNDLRLALGTRLAVTEEGADRYLELPDDDPQRALYVIYDWLTYHQDRLVRILQKGLKE